MPSTNAGLVRQAACSPFQVGGRWHRAVGAGRCCRRWTRPVSHRPAPEAAAVHPPHRDGCIRPHYLSQHMHMGRPPLAAAASTLAAQAVAARLVCKLLARRGETCSLAVLLGAAGCSVWAGGDRTTLRGSTANECCAMPSRWLALWAYPGGRLTAGKGMMICDAMCSRSWHRHNQARLHLRLDRHACCALSDKQGGRARHCCI